jgi:hypothetical protein
VVAPRPVDSVSWLDDAGAWFIRHAERLGPDGGRPAGCSLLALADDDERAVLGSLPLRDIPLLDPLPAGEFVFVAPTFESRNTSARALFRFRTKTGEVERLALPARSFALGALPRANAVFVGLDQAGGQLSFYRADPFEPSGTRSFPIRSSVRKVP